MKFKEGGENETVISKGYWREIKMPNTDMPKLNLKSCEEHHSQKAFQVTIPKEAEWDGESFHWTDESGHRQVSLLNITEEHLKEIQQVMDEYGFVVLQLKKKSFNL